MDAADSAWYFDWCERDGGIVDEAMERINAALADTEQFINKGN